MAIKNSDPNEMAKALDTATNFAKTYPKETAAAMKKPKKESLVSKVGKKLKMAYFGSGYTADADKLNEQVKKMD
jgi:hypothetical protein